MRKVLLSLLLATVATGPAFAQRIDRGDRQQARAERSEARAERQSREDRQQAREERDALADRAERVRESRVDVDGRARADVRADVRVDGRADRASLDQIRAVREAQRQQSMNGRELRQERRQDVREQRIDNRQLRQAQRARPPVLRDRVPVVSRVPRAGTQPPPRVEQRYSAPVRWSTGWRNNSRYDWYNWRNRNRSLFRIGFYSDPFGWGYQPYSIGWRMWPSYYRSSYWLNDPWQYRLPYAPPGTRWVRYYNDAVLVDTWDGRVVDVIYSFFW